MKNHANRRSVGMKTFVAMLALVLVIGCAVGGTVAWLTAQTGPVVNTFTYGDINIDLTETNETYKMVPGYDIHKDPKATVLDGSEECYLFVKLDESTNFDDYMTYEMADGWTELKGVADTVYYRVVDGTTNQIGTAYSVLKDDQVTVKGSVTKEQMNALDAEGAAKPTLTITAYASQLYKSAGVEFTPADAWKNVNPTTNP